MNGLEGRNAVIVGTGIDIIEVERIKNACGKTRFLERVFTEREREYFKSRRNNLYTIAGSFAAKEAVMKAMGTGLGGVGWKDIEVLHGTDGRPYVQLHGRAAHRLSSLGGKRIWISISHIKELAVAQAVIETEEDEHGCRNPIRDEEN